MSVMNIAVLVSGGGTNLQALIDYEKSVSECPYHIAVVISNTKSAYALERASLAGIPSFVKSPYSVMGKEVAEKADRDTKRIAVSDAVLEVCREYKVNAIVLAGYLSVLGGTIIDEYASKIVNLHPALLPNSAESECGDTMFTKQFLQRMKKKAAVLFTWWIQAVTREKFL